MPARNFAGLPGPKKWGCPAAFFLTGAPRENRKKGGGGGPGFQKFAPPGKEHGALFPAAAAALAATLERLPAGNRDFSGADTAQRVRPDLRGWTPGRTPFDLHSAAAAGPPAPPAEPARLVMSCRACSLYYWVLHFTLDKFRTSLYRGIIKTISQSVFISAVPPNEKQTEAFFYAVMDEEESLQLNQVFSGS